MGSQFDPSSWFVSAAMGLLYGVVALAMAIAILAYIWIPLMITVTVIITIFVLARLGLWWHRRQPW